jgi:hypothetical protein
MKALKKHQNNKFGYGIEVFLKKQNVLASYSHKVQCSTMNNPLLILFLLPIYNHLKKRSPMIYSNSNGEKNYVI